MDSNEKIIYIQQQMEQCERGERDYIECPYCGARTHKPEVLCCLLIGKAIRAILQHQVVQEHAEIAERISEAIDKQNRVIVN